jgi:hypothetical protein
MSYQSQIRYPLPWVIPVRGDQGNWTIFWVKVWFLPFWPFAFWEG